MDPATEHKHHKLSIVIISYECREMLLRAIQTVYANTHISFEIICVDNASSDGSADAVSMKFPQVKLIAAKSNLGFAAANNLAAKHAVGQRLLLLNPDTEILDSAIDKIWAYAEETPNAGIWGGRTLFGDGTLNISSCWNAMTPWSLFCRALGLTWLFPRSEIFNSEMIGSWNRDSEREVDVITGCFLLINHDLWKHLKGFNPDFYMYGEEADLCHRASLLGARPRITPKATIIHHGGQSEASSADKLVKVMKGKVTFMNVHWSKGWRLLGSFLFLLTAILRASANLVISPKPSKGTGLDNRSDLWRSAFARRREWMNGWPLRVRK